MSCRNSGHAPPDGKILLATNLRVLGYLFNPVSFFYLLDADGRTALVLAEVSNTMGESRPYVLARADAVEDGRLHRHAHAKELHVSPFFGMHQTYRFSFSEPGEQLYVRIDVDEANERPFHATVVGSREALTVRSLALALVRYPLMTARVTTLIHWQAFRLWLKGVPVFRKPPFDSERGSAR